MLCLALLCIPVLAVAQGNAALENQINQWSTTLRRVVKAVVGLAAIGGAAFAYFKMQSDEGGNGKKALGAFIGALIFAALMFQIIDFFATP